MKKKTQIIIGVIVVLVVAILLGIQYYFNKETEKLKEEEKVLNTFDIETKSGEKVETEYFNFDDGKFFLKLPKNFSQLDEETLKVKYPNDNPPTFAFSNDKTTVNVAISLSTATIKDNEIESYLNAMIQTLGDKMNVIETNVFEKAGHNIGQIKFVSTAVDTEIYNHMIVFSEQDKLRIVSFNCTKALQEDWQEVGAFITNSLMFPVEE